MASKRRLHPTVAPTHSRKRVKLSNITNSSDILTNPEKVISYYPPSRVSCHDQLVPDSEPWEENEDSSMYCSEEFEQFTFTKDLTMKNSTSGLPGGYFSCLPTEILHKVLSLLDHKSLMALLSVSHVLMSYVQGYIYSAAGLKHIIPPQPLYYTASKDEFVCMGELMKGLTILQPIKARLKVASFFLNKMVPIHSAICNHSGTSVAYRCLGTTFQTFVSNWEPPEKTKAYTLLKSTADLDKRVSRVLQSVPGSLCWHEKDIRLLHRHLFLAPSTRSDVDYGFWLSLILKPWPMVFQAKLVYLLTAPVDVNGFVSWTEACGCSHLQHTTVGEDLDFSELARALKVMYGNETWTEDDVVTIFNEVTTSTPTGWCLENVAQLLSDCGTDITKGVLGSRAINGQFDDLAVICYHLANCCVNSDTDKDVDWFLDILSFLVHLLPASMSKHQFISNIIGKWRSYMCALFADYDPAHVSDLELDDIELEFQDTLSSMTRFIQSIVQMNIDSLRHQ